MLGDNSAISFGLYYGGIIATPGIFVYLWIIFGNGFRYGLKYLLVCAGISVICFSFASLRSEYWLQQPYWLLTSYLLIIFIPLYCSKLLQQLQGALRQAQEANKAKTDFLANMSHELRTPLNGIIGAADILMESRLNIQQNQMVETVYTSANALLEQIQDILDLSQIEERKFVIDYEQFNLSETLLSVYAMFNVSAEQKGINFYLDIDPGMPNELKGDQSALRKILINLAGNAVKFTNQGFVRIEVDVLQKTNDNYLVRFAIRDTGIGISEAIKDKIFGRFTQADQSTTHSYDGSGLGTTIAKQLVEILGGRIGCTSKEGEGTCFWFELPFDLIEEDKIAPISEELSQFEVACFVSDFYRKQLTQNFTVWQVKSEFFAPENLRKFIALVNIGRVYDTVIVDADLSWGLANDIASIVEDQLSKNVNFELIALTDNSEMVDALTDMGYKCFLHKSINSRLLFNVLFQSNTSKVIHENVVHIADYMREENSKPLQILVAEDNLVNQKVLTEILKKANHKVYLCDNGEDALEYLEHHSVDLMIMDMNMPGCSGLEVIQISRYMNTGRYIPALILSADATVETQKMCKEAGVDAFLTKPCNSARLFEQIINLTNKQSISVEKKVVRPIERSFDATAFINYDTLSRLEELGEGKVFLNELLSGFTESAYDLLRSASNANESGDYLTLMEAIHTLKGSSADLGGEGLMRKCREIEKFKAYQLNSGELNTALKELAELLSFLISEFESYIKK